MTNLLFGLPALGTVLSLTGLPGGSNKIHDKSPYGNVGTITGATWKVLPSGLWYLSFDGVDDYVDCGSDTSLNPTQAISIEFWLYLYTTVLNLPDATNILIERGDGTGAGRAYLWDIENDGNAYCYAGTSLILIWDLTSLAAKTFYHLVLTYDRVNCNGYINASSPSTNAATAAIPSKAQPTTINRIARLKFDMGLFRIYNRALTPFEIWNHFNREKHLFGVW